MNKEKLDPNMQIILDKADNVATDMLKWLDEQIMALGITDFDMRSSLQYAIVKKMEEKIQLPK